MYGSAENVRLKAAELKKLISKFGESGTKDRIEDLSLWKASKGKSTKSDYYTILCWERMRVSRAGNLGKVEVHLPPEPKVKAPPDPSLIQRKAEAIHTMFKRDHANGLRQYLPSMEEILGKLNAGEL